MSATVTQLETVTLTCDTDGCAASFEQTGRYRIELLARAHEAGWRAYTRCDLAGVLNNRPVRHACISCSGAALR